MYHVGLDFGTTNSILAFYDDSRNSIEKFEVPSAREAYLPSYLSVSLDNEDISFGSDAKSKCGDDGYEVYRYFKMLLAETDPQVLQGYGWPSGASKTPRCVAMENIQLVLSSYCKANKLSLPDLKELAVTVPEVWLGEGNHHAREILLDICQEVAGRPVQMVSEPTAASAYFAYNYHLRHKEYFNGHLLVCDFGGGTLDISLSHLEGPAIKVLESTGIGKLSDEAMGAAGVAYDQAVVQGLYVENPDCRYNGLSEYYASVNSFEYAKIEQKNTIDKYLIRYLKEAKRNQKIFTIESMPCKPSDLVLPFKERIGPAINNALATICESFDRHGVSTDDGATFRVIMVGGFSNFYLVEREIMNFFRSKASHDVRFNQDFIDADRNLAIAKGAAILAAKLISLEVVAPVSVGLTTYCYINQTDDKPLQRVDEILLERGTPLSDCISPRFQDGIPIGVNQRSWRDYFRTSIELFVETDSGKRPFELGPLESHLPNPTKDNQWSLAFSMDRNLCYHIHIRDKDGHENSFPLGDVLDKVGA